MEAFIVAARVPCVCGRFANPASADDLASWSDAIANLTMARWAGKRWNAAPTQQLPIIRHEVDGLRHLDLAAWGWRPSWMKTGVAVNARGEEAAEKPTWATAMRSRRCLVPATAFYEWRQDDGQPFAFQRPDRQPFAIGGLWEPGPSEDAFLLLTTVANAVVAPVHDRMALIVPRELWDAWLDPTTPLPTVRSLVAPAPVDELMAVPIGRGVSSVRNDGPHLLKPVAETKQLTLEL